MSRTVNFCDQCGTPLEIRDRHGTLRPICPQCGRVVYFDPKVAVVVFILHNNKVLLVHRAMDPAKGLWALPAGFIEADEAPVDAAVRETMEETGLHVQVTHLLDVYPKHDNGLANIVIAYAAEITGGTLLAADDADEAAWFGRDEIPPLAFYPSKTLIARWQRGELDNLALFPKIDAG